MIPKENRPAPSFPPPEPREERPDARTGPCDTWPDGQREVRKDLVKGVTTVEWRANCVYEIGSRKFETAERNTYTTHDDNPADSSFDGEESHVIRLEGGRLLKLVSHLEVRSDAKDFRVVFSRTLHENGSLLREKTWDERIPRQFQ
jgi:hypothetical protein